MKARTVVVILALVVLIVAGLVAYAWSSRPQITGMSPQAGAENISAVASIRLVFSRPMDMASVSSHLVIEPEVQGALSWEENSLVFTPSQPWPSGKLVSLHLRAGAKAAGWLAFPTAELAWSFTTTQTTLAYLWPADGPADIYALDPVTGEIHRYTHGMDVLEYSASLDGKMLYFSAANAQKGADLFRIDRIEAMRPQNLAYLPEKLLDCGLAQCRNLVVSPDGQTLAYEYLVPNPRGGLGPAQIWTLRLPDLSATPIGASGDETVQPAWSSRGWLAYYDRTTSQYEAINPGTQERIRLPNQTGQPGTWSVDGKYYLAPEISYQQAGMGYETGSSHLYLYSLQGGSPIDLSDQGPVEDVEAAYSPDGEMIAFTRKFLDAERWSLGRQVWVMRSGGSDQRALTGEADYNHYDLAWSRDGLQLAYVRFNQARISQPPELWMANVDGSNPLQLVIGGYSPTWIP